MLLNDIRLQKSSGVALTTGGLSLMVGSLLLSLSALSVYRLNQAQDITINTSSWNWMSEVHLRLDAGQEALGPMLSEAEILEHPFVGPMAPLRVAAERSVPKAKAHLKWIAKAKSVIRRAKAPRPEPETKAIILTQKDEIKSTAAAPVSQSAQASPSELSILQGLHAKLRNQFLLAMSSQTQPSSPEAKTLVAKADQSVQKPELSISEEEQDLEREPAVVEKAAVEVAPEPITIHTLRNRKQTQLNNHALVQPAEAVDADLPVSKANSAMDTQPEMARDGGLDQIHAIQAAPTNDYSPQLISTDTDTPKATAQVSKDEPGKILVSSNNQTVWVAPTILPAPGKAPAAAMSIQPAQAKASALPAATPTHDDSKIIADATTHVAHHVLRELNSTKNTADYSKPSLTTQVSAFLSGHETFVEAFDWVSPLSGATKSYFSVEAAQSQRSKGESSQAAGWILSQAPDHWPTLSRQSSNATPLISNNTSKLLSTLSGAVLQNEAGIVFGKVPAGWSIRLSGRSERPVFLNERNQTVSSSSVEGDRYFAFLNAAPGAHLMYLVNNTGVEEGAIGLAVIGGTATYADLSKIKKATFSGRVFDGSDLQARSMSGITVRVLGALNARTETGGGGRFSIENVLTVGDYPVYVETDAASGYTHRYQFSPNQLQDVTLFRLSEAMIQTWIGQLEGAISPDSGIVVAALSGIIKNQGPKAKLSPIVQSLAANPTLRPEVYTVSAAGQMQVGQALDAQNARFVSVQVPEGPAIARVVDAENSTHQNLVWSEMIMISPAVINMVGPY